MPIIVRDSIAWHNYIYSKTFAECPACGRTVTGVVKTSYGGMKMGILPTIEKCPRCGSRNILRTDEGIKVLYCSKCGRSIDEFGPTYGRRQT